MAAEPSAAGGPHTPAAPAGRTRKKRPLRPAALRGPDAAAYCSIGFSTWARLDAAGLIPAGAMCGGCKIWPVRMLRAWLDRGCLPWAEWEKVWAELLRRPRGR